MTLTSKQNEDRALRGQERHSILFLLFFWFCLNWTETVERNGEETGVKKREETKIIDLGWTGFVPFYKNVDYFFYSLLYFHFNLPAVPLQTTRPPVADWCWTFLNLLVKLSQWGKQRDTIKMKSFWSRNRWKQGQIFDGNVSRVNPEVSVFSCFVQL